MTQTMKVYTHAHYMHKHTDSLQGICLVSEPGICKEMSPRPYQNNSHSVYAHLTSHIPTTSTPKTLTAPGEASAICMLRWPL